MRWSAALQAASGIAAVAAVERDLIMPYTDQDIIDAFHGMTTITAVFDRIPIEGLQEPLLLPNPTGVGVVHLGEARELWTLGHHGAATVIAASVLEVWFNEAITALLEARGSGELAAPLGALVGRNGFALGRDQHLDLFEALAPARLQDAPRWSDYGRGRLRNDWVHGRRISLSAHEAKTFLVAVLDVLTYGERQLVAAGAPPATDLVAAGPVRRGNWLVYKLHPPGQEDNEIVELLFEPIDEN